MPAKKEQSVEELRRQARFIFEGSVQKLGASTMASVPADKNTAIVLVENIQQAPQALAGYNGKEITVQLSGQQKVEEGERAIFYTNGWMYGDSIAVQSVGQLPVPQAAGEEPVGANMLAATPHENLAHQKVQERKSTADLVVQGKVTSVRVPQDDVAAGPQGLAMAAGGGNEGNAPARPISEHDPMWREAVVDVSQVEKGQHGEKNVVVRFPSSTDVRWYRAPKFQPGQEGTFILHRHTLHRPTQRILAEAVGGGGGGGGGGGDDTSEVYTALDPADFQPA